MAPPALTTVPEVLLTSMSDCMSMSLCAYVVRQESRLTEFNFLVTTIRGPPGGEPTIWEMFMSYR